MKGEENGATNEIEKIKCPVCNCSKNREISVRTQEREKREIKAFVCRECKSIYLENYKIDRSYIYENENYSPWGKSEELWEDIIAISKKEAFRDQLSLLKKYINPRDKVLLDIGTGKGYLLEVAKKLGFEVYGVEPSRYCSKVARERFGEEKVFYGSLKDARHENEKFDVITMTDLIEHISFPHLFLKEANRILKRGGIILITTPNSDSFTRRLLGKDWFQYKYEHVIYYNRKSLLYLLKEEGFEVLKTKNNFKRFQIEYYYYYFRHYSFMGIEKVVTFIFPYLPMFIKKFSFCNPITGEMIVVANKV